MAKFSDLNLPATVTDLTMRFDNASILLPTLNLVGLTVNAQGIAQVAGSSIIAATAAFTSNGFALNVSNAGNDFDDLTLSNTGRNDVSVSDLDGLNFSARRRRDRAADGHRWRQHQPGRQDHAGGDWTGGRMSASRAPAGA